MLQATLNKVKPYPKDSHRHQILVNAVGEFICYGLQPISVADDPSVKKLMAKSDPKFQVPSRKYFSQQMIPNKYEAVKCKIQNELSKCKYCAITTDLWTSQHQNRSYISLTAHFVTPEFHLKARCLQTKEILTDHSAQSIAEILRTFIAEWNINFKVFGATTDNGSNVVNAIVDLQLIHMPCIGHTLQLSIKKAFDLPAVQRVIGRY